MKATDGDPDDEVRYSQLVGDEASEKSFMLDELVTMLINVFVADIAVEKFE